MPKNPNRKVELIEPGVFSALSPQAKRKLCLGAAGSAPSFVVEIAKSMKADFCFSNGYGERSVVEEALAHGQAPLLRWACSKLARSAMESVSAPYYQSLFEQALESPWSDAQVLRARGWLRSALLREDRSLPGPPRLRERCRPAGASHPEWLAREAGMALAHGRPGLAALLCEELVALGQDGAKAARPERGLDEISRCFERLALPAIAWQADGEIDHQAWRKKLSWEDDDEERSNRRAHTRPKELLSSTPLAAFAHRWAMALEKAAPASPEPLRSLALASRLESASDALWRLGALSTPQDFKRRFLLAPDEAESDALALRIGHLRPSDKQLMIAPLWLDACARPRKEIAGLPLWDLFCSRFQGAVEGVDPNPFLPFGSGSCPALWSLSLGGELIELGLERGFDPKACSRVATLKSSLGRLAIATKVEPFSTREWRPEWGYHAALGEWQTLDGSVGVNACRVLSPKTKAGQTKPGLPLSKPTGSMSERQWMRSNFATLALLAGKPDLCQRLAQAGCEVPSTQSVAKEAREMGMGPDACGKLESQWNAFELALDLRLKKQTKSSPPPASAARMRL